MELEWNRNGLRTACPAQNEHDGMTSMALDVFSTPATSVEVERLFSRAGRTVTPLRHRLRAERISQLVTVGKWFSEGAVPETLLPDVLSDEAAARKAKRAKIRDGKRKAQNAEEEASGATKRAKRVDLAGDADGEHSIDSEFDDAEMSLT
ncbi:hypothetical protein CF319_g7243 [Tilletia indica]|nr:hypothetical protein CF319_g7243 [Tilletia indica]